MNPYRGNSLSTAFRTGNVAVQDREDQGNDDERKRVELYPANRRRARSSPGRRGTRRGTRNPTGIDGRTMKTARGTRIRTETIPMWRGNWGRISRTGGRRVPAGRSGAGPPGIPVRTRRGRREAPVDGRDGSGSFKFSLSCPMPSVSVPCRAGNGRCRGLPR